jgi:ferric enterobactin receptor
MKYKLDQMKSILILTLALLTGIGAMAQFPGGGGKGQSVPNMGHIYGKVVDSVGKGINDASVILLQNKFDSVSKKRKDVLLKGLSTKGGGEFSLEDLPMFGQLKLKISALGYKPYEQVVAFQMKMPAGGGGARQSQDPSAGMASMSNMVNGFDKDLGNIKLSQDMKQLDVVTVTASKPLIRMDIDKKVYNVEKDMVNAGGTALDLMKNVPSVNVDIDGNVSLRNAPPQIYVDGRPTTLTLDQIPADAIESIEVITNPSAKYDASGGGAGILNIVLKKNKKTGYNGNLRAGVDSRGGINGGGNFSLRQNKFNFTAAGFINQNRGVTNGTTNRTNIADTPSSVNQTTLDKNKGGFMFGSLGADYFLTNRTTISLTGIRVHGQFEPNQVADIYNNVFYPDSTVSSYSQKTSNSKRIFNAYGVQAGFKHLFPREGENLTADLNFFSGKNNNSSLYVTDYFNDGPGSSLNHMGQQKVDGNGNNQFLTIQTDYVRPFNAKTKLETGLRFQKQELENNQYNYLDTLGDGNYYLVPSASTNYVNTNYVYAAYVSFTSGYKDFGYQIGLRGERSNYTGELTNLKQTFSNQYPISLFPSMFLSQKLSKTDELQMSYTRRINRPNFFQLIPFTDYTDTLNITRGNPNLVPEFTNSLEMSYSKTLPHNNTILASVYYKQTTNLITRFLDTATNPLTGKQDLINTWENANSSRTMGAELTSVTTINKWWDITANINVYNSHINVDNISGAGTSQDALWSWFAKLNTNFKFPWKVKLQITGTYQSKTNLPVNSGGGGMGGPPGGGPAQSSSQGYIQPFYGIDAAISRSFLKNDAATLSVSMGDIFRTRWSKQHSESPFFIQDYNRLRDPQLVRVNFTWRFGKIDVSLFKRKNLNAAGGASDATQGMQ